ncbi:LysM peptidoglycan-binding domain-containing protein [Fibrivirga algicola]|uniref:LysM peptidoglycan-binding domain-containing protein n=1 Tax=Fibrivirga algicola TaxID=2950420 RepID=A0ABX0QIZ1_9BACT|nr:LysM peptidoglycan-binding domain-containing protein [Fibrivirga algicola]NID11798.1 LysM peptidoglycan-binding domain-containing protein [Fibrivirga algicola]
MPTELNVGGATVYLNAQSQQRLQDEINGLYADRSVLRNTIEQMQYIESVLGPLLEEHAIPADFRYVCLPSTLSNGAYWGLDARKATRLNLRIDNSVDERLNVVSSTEAVLNELAALHTKSPNWMRVLLSFAAGQRPDDLAGSAQSGVGSLPNDQVSLDGDAPALIWLLLARKIVFEREAPLIRPNASPYLLYDYRQSQGKTLAAIARELQIEQPRFMPFNEWLRVRVIPSDKPYPVLIRLTPSEFLAVRGQVNSTIQFSQPAQQGQPVVRRDMGFPVLRKLTATTSNDPLTRAAAQFYEINDRKGIQAQTCDNLITLAYYGRLSVAKFMEINDMSDRDLVRPGEIYYLEPKAKKAMIPFHVMQAGQTLREVSTIYGVRMNSLLKYNHIEANQRLQPGRILWLREKRPKKVPAEYQVLPNPVLQSEPTVAQRNLTRENEESLIDSPSPPNWRVQPVDSANAASLRRESETSLPTNGPEQTTPGVSRPTAATQVSMYTVKDGDTHSGVAQQFNLSLADLMTWNNLSYRKPLVAGQRLVVRKPAPPVPIETARPVPNQPTLLDADPAVNQAITTTKPTVTGASGTSSTSVATRPPVGTVPAGGVRENSESPVDIDYPVKAPVKAPIPPRPERLVNSIRVETPKTNGRSYYHVVQRGQTVYRVALINKVSVQNVMRWNNLTNYTIEIGQRILIRK